MTATPARATADTSAATNARNAGRLAAVQALYQIDVTGAVPAEVIKDFLTGRTGGILMTEDPDTAQESVHRAEELDTETFIGLVRGVEDQGSDIDDMIKGAVSAEWP